MGRKNQGDKIVLCVILLTVLMLAVTGCGGGIKFSSKDLASGRVGETYHDSVAVGKEDIYYELDYDADLPKGLTLSEDGIISGVPGEAGSVTFLVIASAGDEYKEAEFTITIEMGTLAYTGQELEAGKTGEPYLQNVGTASGGENISYMLKEGERLPGGLSLNEAGEISGIPEETDTVVFSVIASAPGCESVEAEYSVTIGEGESGPTDLGHIVFEGWKLPDAEVGTAYNENIRKAYGVPGITYSVKYINGVSFPKGVSFNEMGFIHGTPLDSTSGPMQFQITASAEGYEPVTADCELRVYDVYAETTVLEAEHIDVSKLQGAGYSSSPSGKGMLQKFANASGGYALGYLHKEITVDFYFEAEQAAAGTLVLGLGTEVGTISFTPETFKIYINDAEIDYGSFEVVENGTGQTTVFQEISITPAINIQAGDNKLTLEVLNTTVNEGIGTSTAKGPIVDYIRIDDTDTKIGWYPVIANTK